MLDFMVSRLVNSAELFMNLYFYLCFSYLDCGVAPKIQVVTPTGNVLVNDLTLKVESGSNLLITGSHMNSLLAGRF